MPHRTLARFAVERCGAGRRKTTVRVDDPPAGTELQVDFGRLGLVRDGERRRVCHGLVFTACYSRHLFVWPTLTQGIADVLEGFEAAFRFFSGVFPVVMPENVPRNTFGVLWPAALCSRVPVRSDALLVDEPAGSLAAT